MGLLDWIFGPKPQWFRVTQNNFAGIESLNKTEAKKILRDYLAHCNFDKEYIKDEVEDLVQEMDFEVENLQDDIDSLKDEIRNLKKERDQIKKTGKDASGKIITDEERRERLEDLNTDIEDQQDELQNTQAQLKEMKGNWLPFLIDYINRRVDQENAPDN